MDKERKDGLTVLGLHVENIRCVKVISLYPPATGVVKIKGRNAAGKSSTLDAIEAALGGKSRQPEQPVRHGQKSAVVVADLGGRFTIKRTWTDKGTYLTVESKQDGATVKVARPQEFLDSVVGSGIGFDPLEFCTTKPADQVEMLLNVLNLPEDPRQIDQQRKVLYDQRTLVNRQLKQAEAVLATMPMVPDGIPDEALSVSALVEEAQRRQEQRRENDGLRHATEDMQAIVEELRADREGQVRVCIAKVERLKTELMGAEAELGEARMNLTNDVAEAHEAYTVAAEKVAGLVDPDIAEIQEQLANIEATNRHVQNKQQRTEAQRGLASVEKEAADLSEKIDALDKRKMDVLTQATFPIPNLGIAESNGGYTVTFKGIPLADCASSEKLRVSMALAMALNPQVRVILVREGSLLDEESKAVLEQVAREKGYQIWCEIVGTAKEDGAFVIEEGELVET